jgi:hypothetical protein
MITISSPRKLLLVVAGVLSFAALAAGVPGIPAAADRARIVHGLG